MPYAFSQDMPASKEIYTKLSDEIGDEAPKGLIVHLGFETSTGMHIVEVWENQQEFDRFSDQHLRPKMGKILQDAGLTLESMPMPHKQDLKPVEIFGNNIRKRRLS